MLAVHPTLVIMLLLVQGTVSCGDVRSLSQRLDAALARYERDIAPIQPTRVHLALHLRHAAVRDFDSTVHILADLAVSWVDPRIAWNASEWGCDSVVALVDRLWLPEVSLLNGIGSISGDGAAARARLSSDGRIAWLQRYDATVPVDLDLARWPRDTQTAIFRFGSRTMDMDDLELESDDSMPAVTFESGTWELVGLSGGVSAGGEVLWTVKLRRRGAVALASAGAALAATATLLAAAALRPAPHRPALCAVAALIAALWLSSAAWRVDGGSGAPGVVAALGTACAAAGGMALVAALSMRLPCTGRPPPTLTAAVTKLPHCCKPRDEESGGARGAWTALEQLIDRAATVALLVTMLVCFALFY
ncbi:hypothetical protein ACJJTC_015123 [Scirpophaga incertulas]